MTRLPRPICRLVLLLLPACSAAMAGPRLEIEPSEWHFEKIYKGAAAEHEFVIRNTGDADLSIDRIRPSCEVCLSTDRTLLSLSPGEAKTLKVRYSAVFEPGTHSGSVSIESNDEAVPVRRIEIRATIVSDEGLPRAVFEPTRIKLGNVRAGERLTARIAVSNPKDAKEVLNVHEIRAAQPCRVVQSLPVTVGRACTSYPVGSGHLGYLIFYIIRNREFKDYLIRY